MRLWTRTGTLFLAFSVAACENVGEGEHPVAEEVPPETAAYSVESAEGPGAPPSQKIVVTNPLDEPMIVTVQYDGKTERLGTVDETVTGEFFLQVPTGSEVVLIATDAAGAERYRETVVLSDETAWQIR